MEIVKLIGEDVLPDEQKAVLEITRVIRIGFLQQNAYHKDDTYVPLMKQYKMMELILHLYDRITSLISKGVVISKIRESGISEEVIRVKYNVGNDDLTPFDVLTKRVDEIYEAVLKQNS